MTRALRSPVVGAAVDAYDRHVGRYGPELAREMIRVTGVRSGQRALDVGCGTGALTVALAEILGAANVAAIDPSERFVMACRGRLSAADVRVGVGEELPWDDAEFDAVLAQLVVNGMNDARRGAREMRRVARPGAALSACVWDFDRGMSLLRAVWDSALEVDAGADYADFDDLWYPFANGVGNLGRFHEALDEQRRERFKRGAAERLGSPSGPFRLTASAWYVRGTAPAG